MAEPTDLTTIAGRLTDALHNRGIRASDLARELGVSRQDISGLAQGARPRLALLKRVAAALNTTPQWLSTGSAHYTPAWLLPKPPNAEDSRAIAEGINAALAAKNLELKADLARAAALQESQQSEIEALERKIASLEAELASLRGAPVHAPKRTRPGTR